MNQAQVERLANLVEKNNELLAAILAELQAQGPKAPAAKPMPVKKAGPRGAELPQ